MRSGTLVIAVHNLDMSGANQVLINVINDQLNETSNVLIVSPSDGPAMTRFTRIGTSIRIGNVKKILKEISDVLLVICNTIMSADVVLMVRMLRIELVDTTRVLTGVISLQSIKNMFPNLALLSHI